MYNLRFKQYIIVLIRQKNKLQSRQITIIGNGMRRGQNKIYNRLVGLLPKTGLIAITIVVFSGEPSQGWSPGNSEEQRYFNQYVREQLVYIPPTPVYDSNGDFSHYEGPTYEQQYQWEYDRQIAAGKNAANTRAATQKNSSQEVKRLQNELANDPRMPQVQQNKAKAEAELNAARQRQPDGPLRSEVNKRLGDPRTAGGRLDANRDGTISEAEMKAALATRVSMQSTQYDDEKKLDTDGNNEIGKTERGRGLVEVTGQNSLDHHGLLAQRKAKPNYKETGIGNGTFVDANGNTRTQQSLNNPAALNAQLDHYNARRDAAKYSRDNDKMTATKLRNGQLPTTTQRHAEIKTTGTWGTTRSWDRSWDAGGGINRNTSQIQSQMANPNAGNNNQFYNRAQASTAGLQGANASARANVSQAQAIQNTTTGFKNAQGEVNTIYNSLNR